MREGGLPCKSKGRRRNKNKEKSRERGAELSDLVQPRNKIREKTFGAAKGDKESGLGVDMCDAKEEKSQPTFFFQLFGIHTYTFLQRIISLYTRTRARAHIHTHTHTHIYIYIYIYPYLYKTISITLKEHICFIISQ